MPNVPALKYNRKKDHVSNMTWPDTVRKKVVKTWLQTGSLPLTAQLCKVPLDTVENWRYRHSWWKEYVQKFREEADASMAARIEKLLGKTVEQLEDRVENGEEVFNPRTGEFDRVKMKLRDLNTSLKVLTDRHDVLTERAKKEVTATEQINDKLSKLANAFEKFAKKETKSFKIDSSEVLDVEFEEVIPDHPQDVENVSMAP